MRRSPEIMVCRILMFRWSSGPLVKPDELCSLQAPHAEPRDDGGDFDRVADGFEEQGLLAGRLWARLCFGGTEGEPWRTPASIGEYRFSTPLGPLFP